MRTHRCEESLKRKISIRYDYPSRVVLLPEEVKAWRLFHLDYGDSYTPYLSHVTEISFCPFCGEKLED